MVNYSQVKRPFVTYYPSIFALEEISFMLMRAMQDKQRQRISENKWENILSHLKM